jgi:hypothetical protein
VPPPPSLKVVVSPTQTFNVPVIVAGKGNTVTVVLALQPVGNVYVIAVVPAAMPYTSPVVASTVATAVFELLQVPVPISPRVVTAPAHTKVAPKIVPGNGLTVTIEVEEQPLAFVKLMIAVPADTPVTRPDPGTTVATVVLPLLHVPIPPSLKVVVEATHTTPVPIMGPGIEFTVITAVTKQLPGSA